MKQETLDMLLEILMKLGCSEETMNAVKADPALKVEDSEEEEKTEKEDSEEEDAMESKAPPKEGVAVVIAKKEEEASPMKELMKSMLKSR